MREVVGVCYGGEFGEEVCEGGWGDVGVDCREGGGVVVFERGVRGFGEWIFGVSDVDVFG